MSQISLFSVMATFLLSISAQAAFLPVCERTPAVAKFLEQNLRKDCKSITEEDLLTVKRIAPAHAQVTQFKKDDFSGLKNLEILNIRSNPYTELTEGLFDDLENLRTLVIISTSLRHFPDDFLAKNPKIENIHVFANQVRSISESVFQRLASYKNLKIIDFDEIMLPAEQARLRALFPEGGPVQLFFN